MALPTPEKTWNTILNSANATSTGVMWAYVKNTLLGIAPGWALVGSGGADAGGGGGMDAVDRWLATTIVSNNWVVLQNDAISIGFQILLQPTAAGGGAFNGARIGISPGGLYTGGAQTTAPTATDEVRMTAWVQPSFYRASNPTQTARVSAWMSSDGECTRLVFCETGATRAFLLFDKAKNPVSGWTVPWVAMVATANNISRVPEYTDLNDVTLYTRSAVGATEMDLFCTSEGWVDSMMGERLTSGNDLDSNGFSLGAMGLACEGVGVTGRHGELFDLWWGSNAVADGGHYPNTTPRQFVQVGDVVMKWDPALGSALLLA